MTLSCVHLQFVYAGKRATLNIGNIKPIGDMPEGTIICNVEEVCLSLQPARLTKTLSCRISVANRRCTHLKHAVFVLPWCGCQPHAYSLPAHLAHDQLLYCSAGGPPRVICSRRCPTASSVPNLCAFLVVAQKAGDRGSIARASGDYCIVVAHNPDTGVSRIKLPSGSKKVLLPRQMIVLQSPMPRLSQPSRSLLC